MDVIRQMQVTQQLTFQQLQALSNASAPVAGGVVLPPPPPPPPADPPAEAPVDEGSWWYQGPRTCRKCGQKSYLRQNICYNMDCVSK